MKLTNRFKSNLLAYIRGATTRVEEGMTELIDSLSKEFRKVTPKEILSLWDNADSKGFFSPIGISSWSSFRVPGKTFYLDAPLIKVPQGVMIFTIFRMSPEVLEKTFNALGLKDPFIIKDLLSKVKAINDNIREIDKALLSLENSMAGIRTVEALEKAYPQLKGFIDKTKAELATSKTPSVPRPTPASSENLISSLERIGVIQPEVLLHGY